MSLTLNDTHELLALANQLEAIPEAKEVKEKLEEFLAEEGFDESGFDPNSQTIKKGKKMSKYKHYVGTAWVSVDGSFSFNNELITFDSELLTEEQWDKLAELHEHDRIEYAMSIIDGEDLSGWEDN